MEPLEEANAEIERARSAISDSEVRTQLESITVSLQEMRDSAAGERTDGDEAFADVDVSGTTPSDDNLRELEDNLTKLAENMDQEDVRSHLENAQRTIGAYRTELESDE